MGRIIWRTLWARPLRTVLTAIAVALGVAVVLGVQVAASGLTQQAVSAQQVAAGKSDLDIRVATGAGLTADNVTSLRGLAGVEQAAPLYEKRDTAYTSVQDSHGETVTLVSISHGMAALRPVTLAAGRLPSSNSADEVVVDTGLAAQIQAATGTRITLKSTLLLTTDTGPKKFTVVGLSSGTSAGAAFTNSAVFVPETTLSMEFANGLRIPLVALRLSPTASPVAVAGQARTLLGNGATVVDPRAAAAPQDQITPLLVLLTVLSLIIGAAVTANSIVLSVTERRRELSLLRAAGASGSQVFRLFVGEAGAQALLGLPVGVGGGALLGEVLINRLSAAGLPTPGMRLSIENIGGAIVIGLGAALLGSTIPAAMAAHSPILDGLRQHAAERERTLWRVVVLAPALAALGTISFLAGGEVAGAIGSALVLAAAACVLPLVLPPVVRLLARPLAVVSPQSSVAASNLVRRRNRSTLTAAGLVIAIGAAIAISCLAAGATGASDQWIAGIFPGQMIVKSPVPQSDAIAEAVAHDLKTDATDPNTSHPLAGHVTAVVPVRIIPAAVGGDVLGIAAVPYSAPPANSTSTSYLNQFPAGALDFLSGNRTQAIHQLTTSQAVLAPESLANADGWVVGSRISIEGANNTPDTFTIAGIVSHTYPSGDGRESLIMDTAVADYTFGTETVGGSTTSPAVASGFDFLIVSTDGSPAGQSAVQAIAARYGFQATPVSAIQASARQALDHAVGLLEAVAIIAIVIAMLSLINSVVVNVRLGARDVALLRAVGLSRRSALQLMLAEAVLLALAAAILGLATGAILAAPLLAASSTVGFAPVYIFPVLAAVAIAVAVVLAAVVATLVPARRTARANIVAAIRYE